MTREPNLPDLGGGPAFEHTLLARAFHLLLDDHRPVSAARLAQALACDSDRVEQALASLDRQGRLRRDPAGAVSGSHGLSLTPTAHELLLEHPAGRGGSTGPGVPGMRSASWPPWTPAGGSARPAPPQARRSSSTSTTATLATPSRGWWCSSPTPTAAPLPMAPTTIRTAAARGR